MNAETEARKAKLLGALADEAIMDALAGLAARSIAREESLAVTWLIGELEARHPEVDDAMNEWMMSTPEIVTRPDYIKSLIGFVKAQS